MVCSSLLYTVLRVLRITAVSVVQISYHRQTGFETWITSDGRAYLVQLVEDRDIQPSASEVSADDEQRAQVRRPPPPCTWLKLTRSPGWPLRPQQAVFRKLHTAVPVAGDMYTPRRTAALGAETQAGRPWRRRCVRIQRAPASDGDRAEPEVLHARHRDVQVSMLH